MELEKDAATMIRQALMAGGTLEGIAKELGKLAAQYPDHIYPESKLPTSIPLFDAGIGLQMQNAYNAGIIYIERLDLT
jgi:hypothetical protein